MRRLCLVFVLTLLPLRGLGAVQASLDKGPALIERVWPSDFENAESLFGEKFSADNEVVFLRIDKGIPDYALSLKRESDRDYSLTLTAYRDHSFKKATVPLPASVAAQISRAIEFKLNRHVMIGTTRRAGEKRTGDLWIFHRNARQHAEAGIILFEATLDSPDAKLVIDDLLGGLQRLIAADDAERETILGELDRTATQIILTAESR
jgi:hypothetical protein